jgi:hypothetical protein
MTAAPNARPKEVPNVFALTRSGKQGQILAVFAGALVVIVLVVGLALDAGNVFLQRRGGQNDADIGAMAGTKRLFDYYVSGATFSGSNNVYTAINTRMGENNCAGGTSTCTWTARYVGPRVGASFLDLGPVTASDTAPPTVGGQQAMGVKVDVHRTPNTFLLGLIGQTAWNVNTTATGMSGSITTPPGGQLLPIAMTEMPTQEGTIYALTSGANGPGNFGWLSWDGSNDAGTLAASICTPNNPPFTLPAQFPGDPGKTNASSVRDCLSRYINKIVLIPIVLKSGQAANPSCSTGGNGNNFHYCIIGVAAFVLTSYSQPAVDQINGRFVGTVPYSIGGNENVPGGVTVPPSAGSAVNFLGLAQ